MTPEIATKDYLENTSLFTKELNPSSLEMQWREIEQQMIWCSKASAETATGLG